MLASAVVGGVLLGMIEGIGILMNRFSSQMYRMPDPMSAPQDPSQLGEAPSSLGGVSPPQDSSTNRLY